MAGIPQVITEDRASGAQFIDGSLKFDSGKFQHLKRTYNSAGNRRFWTWSAWIKRGSIPSSNVAQSLFGAYYNSSSRDVIRISGEVQDTLSYQNGNAGDYDSSTTSAVLRDIGWYHFVISADLNQGTQTNRVKIYVNGELQSKSNDAQATRDSFINWEGAHFIGARSTDGTGSAFWDGEMSQVYFIDGQALGPEEFGYTDPLTNTWRPKKFEHLSTAITTQYSGASALTWDDNPIGSIYTLSNGNRTATAGQATSSGYTGADVWSNAIPADSTTAWTLEITNSDSVGGWYFTDSQTPSGTHPDERGGNSMGLRNQDADAAFRGTFATANGYSNSGNQLSLLSCHTWGSKRVDFVVYRPASGNGKVWVKNNGSSTWVGGGNPSDTSSTPSFNIPDGNTYFGYTFYDRSNGDQIATLDGDGSIQQKLGPNSFYLPLDGNTPIGQDQSGKGNNWEPVSFGGSVTLDNPTVSGAIPILNTNEAGTVAKKGVRTDKKTYTVTASGGNYYLDGALKPTLNAYRGGSYTFDYTGATSHPLYLSGMSDGKHNSKAYSVSFDGANGTDLQLANHTDLQVGSESNWTIEFFVRKTGAFADYDVITGKGGSGQYEWFIEGFANGQVRFLYSDNGTSTWTGNHVLLQYMNDNQWYHFAAVRNGTSFKMYVDGIETFSTTGFNIHAGTGPLHIGGYSGAAGQDPPVQISNYRIVKGTSVYTSNFRRPGTTLENITNTKLLCCHDSSATTATVSPVAITSNGGVSVIQTHQPFLYIDSEGGVNTATSNTTKITIPHHAADTLYYYCNAHSGMGSSINVTTDIRKADPYAWKCMFAMASDMVDHSPEINVNSTASSFGDIHTTTPQGLRNLYGHSKKMESGGGFRIDMELTTAEANAKHKFDTNDFTLECWHYNDGSQSSWHSLFRSAAYNNPSGTGGTGIAHYGNSQTLWPYSVVSGNGQNWGQTGNVVPYKKWHHTAWTRQAGVNRIFANGILVKTFNNSNSWDNRGWEIGDVHTWTGGYQDARIYNGVAKYTENFVVGSTTPDVLPDTPSGITGKTNLTKITEGAVSFDGNGDYLSLASTSDFDFGTGDFTCELFFRCTDYSNTPYFFDFRTTGGAESGAYVIYVQSTGTINFWYDGSSRVTSNNKIPLNSWVHLAVVRYSGTTKMYIDGVAQTSSYSDSNDYGNGGSPLFIGVRRNSGSALASQSWNGQLSNVRVLKGTALYTSDFTPPTESLTEVTNTKLLCCQSTTSATAAAVTPGAVSTPAAGYAFNSAKLYSVFGSGTRSANYTVEYSDDNSSWTTAFTGTMTTSSCGLVGATGGGGNYGKHPYWRYTNNEGTGSHHPRMARLVLSDGTTDVNIQTFTGDNCSDQGTIPGNGTQYTYTDSTYVANNPSATAFNPFTDDINTIRGQETGYATLNPLSKHSDIILSNGNLTFTNASTAGWRAGGSIGHGRPSSGKYYFETQLTTVLVSNSYNHFAGVLIQDNYNFIGGDFANNANGYCIGAYTGSIRTRNSGSYGPSITKASTTGAILQVAIDVDNGKLWFGCDNVWASGSPHSNTSPSYTFTAGTPFSPHFATYGANASMDVNFGQKPFKFPPPDGFQPLNLSNVQPEKVIARPDQYLNTVLYNGTGTNGENSINVGLKPDFVWIKERTGAFHHVLYDSVRGVQKSISTSRIDIAEYTETYGLNRFTATGFDLAANNGYYYVNRNNEPYVAWCWKAGGNKNTFNIDDVGYANASDVNMNAGALNNYNNGQIWSSGLSGSGSGGGWASGEGPTVAFDGDTSTRARWTGTSSGVITATLPTAISATKLRVKGHFFKNNSVANEDIMISVNGGTYVIPSDAGLITYDEIQAAPGNNLFIDCSSLITGGQVSSVSIKRRGSVSSASGLTIYAIEVDGKILVDSNQTPPNVPSIAPTGCSVGTKQGFSIVKWTGDGSDANRTVPHGLLEAPSFVIVKPLTETNRHWLIWHKGYNDDDAAMLFDTGIPAGARFGPDAPTSNVFGVYGGQGNRGTTDFIGYCWHDVPGLQKFGTYTGNGSSDGPFIELGFKPAIFWMKAASGSGANWVIIDSKRPGYNPDQKTLCPNLSNAENASGATTNDILSNGFKVRGTTDRNANGVTYIYCAWAEAPSINLYGAQSNAR